MDGIAKESSVEKLANLRIESLDNDDDLGEQEQPEAFTDEDDGMDDDEEEQKPAILGFVQKPENQWCLLRQYFPSKAGGIPAWLDPINLPSGSSSVCDLCGEPLQFVLQLYAPLSDEHHRTLFVFMCMSMTCLLRDQHEQWKRHPEKASRSVKVFCCQLPHINPFYSSKSPRDDGSEKPSGPGAILCSWCGTWKGNQVCSGCRKWRYCSRKHQAMHWRSGHNIECQQCRIFPDSTECTFSGADCTSAHIQKVRSKSLWPEYELVSDDECEDDEMPEDKECTSSLVTRNPVDDTLSSLLDEFVGDRDKRCWASFQERIAKAPSQVLRFCRGDKPLWPMMSGRPSELDIPNCSYCGGPRCFEFQIMPQLLYYFDVKNDVDSLDWATIAIYTCESFCDTSDHYKEEFAWVQLYPQSVS